MNDHSLPLRPESRSTDDVFAQLFDVSPIPAVVSRLGDQIVVAVNGRAAEILGRPQREVIGSSAADYYMDFPGRAELAEQLERDGRSDNFRVRITPATGDTSWVVASARLIDWHGERAVLTVFHDITEQLAVESSLEASERRLAAQSDALTSLTSRYTNPTERFGERLRSILEIAAHALRVERLSMWRFERERSEIHCVGLFHVAARVHEAGSTLRRDDAPTYFVALEQERVIAAGNAAHDPRTCEFRDTYLAAHDIGAMLDVPLRHDNLTVGVLCAEHVGGERMWTVDEQNFAISVANLIVVALVEEEHRSALVRLAESEARARLIVDTAHDAFIGIDSSGGIVAWNAQAERTFGWSREEAVGRNLADTIIPAAFRDAHNSGMRRFHKTGDAPVVNQRLELTALHRSGREFPVELTITSPMHVENGFFFGAFLRDISSQRERDAELRRAKESAEAATRAKSEFLANMSHELRTPLNGVLGYAQLLQRDKSMTGAQREALEAVATCGSQLLDLINDVLDLSKIEAGRLDIEEEATHLPKLVDDVRDMIAAGADRKSLNLKVAIDPTLPEVIVVDGRRLRQVLLNLLGNAIKFTAAGEVGLIVGRDGDERVRFEVTDTGAGIEPEALTEIFAAFAQTKAGAAAGGTGLGLTISDHLISKMGGELQVQSVVGEGSRFWFTLPLVPAREIARPLHHDFESDAPALDARLAPGEHVTALVVDDSVANRRILAGLLESAGVDVITASGGLEALSSAEARKPDIIFMDLKMDDLDGLEVTRRLARNPATAAIPVVAVTASAFGDIRQTAREAGCVDYLSKPVRVPLLFAMLKNHLGAQFVSESDRSAARDRQLGELERRSEIAARLREAVAIGDVGEIQALAQRLMEGDRAEAAVGERISRLAVKFDFDALGKLADSLTV